MANAPSSPTTSSTATSRRTGRTRNGWPTSLGVIDSRVLRRLQPKLFSGLESHTSKSASFQVQLECQFHINSPGLRLGSTASGGSASRKGEELNTVTDILFLSHPDPMWVYDLDTLRFLAVNKAAVAKYGYSHDEFLAMTIADIRPSEDKSALVANGS